MNHVETLPEVLGCQYVNENPTALTPFRLSRDQVVRNPGPGSQCAEGPRFSRVGPEAGSNIGSRNAGRERPEGPVDPRRPAWYARYRICGAICGAVSGRGRVAAPIPDVGVGTVSDDDGGS